MNAARIISRIGQLKTKPGGVHLQPPGRARFFKWRFNIAGRLVPITQVHRQTGVMFRISWTRHPANRRIFRTVFRDRFLKKRFLVRNRAKAGNGNDGHSVGTGFSD